MTTAHGLMFHHFVGGAYPRMQGALSADDFDAMLQFVGIDRIMPADEWKRRAEAGRLSDEVCITFDDALRCQFDIAKPVLERYGLTAFWFVYSSVFEGHAARLEIYRHYRCTRFESVEEFYDRFEGRAMSSHGADMLVRGLTGFDADRYLSDYPFFTTADRRFRFIRDEILGQSAYEAIMDAMIYEDGVDASSLAPLLWMDDSCLSQLRARGHIVGLHSYSHPLALADLPAAEQRHEYAANHAHLARVLGDAPQTMSHPSNSYRPETLEILRELGVSLGFRADMAKGYASPLEHPREDSANLMHTMGRR